MDKIANLPMNQRAELFQETGARRNISLAIVEKDFWVCWVLSKIFKDPYLSKKLLFKGGTSLSKVFNLIERFSEDIDLILDWREVTSEDPMENRSKSKQAQFNKKIQLDTHEYLYKKFIPKIQSILGDKVVVTIEKSDPNVISILYPSAFSNSYIRPEIKLEIGPLAIWTPNGEFLISPYCSQEFPSLFTESNCIIYSLLAERTFWEKITILHHEAYRPVTSPQPIRYSRHYYDVYCLAKSDVKIKAMNNLELLKSVVVSKELFYPRNWANYNLAIPGTIKLMPPAYLKQLLIRDYEEMQVMIFGTIPTFFEILDEIQKLEYEINNI